MIDSLEWEEVSHYRGDDLGAAIDAYGEYHPHVPDVCGGNLCIWWNFFNDAVIEAWGVIHGKVLLS